MRAEQLWRWIYHYGVTDFAAMTNVAKELRATLAEHYSLSRPEIVTGQVSTDGTRKWLLRLAADEHGQRHEVEAGACAQQLGRHFLLGDAPGAREAGRQSQKAFQTGGHLANKQQCEPRL